MTNQQLLIIMIVLFALLIAMVVYTVIWKKKKQKASKIISYKSDKKNHIYGLYKVYTRTPILNRYFNKILTRLETMYPADRIAITAKATKDMTYALGLAILCGAGAIIISRGDIFYICIGFLLTYLLFTQMLTGRIEKMEDKLDKQFSDFLTSVRHYYHDTNDVCDAVYSTLDEVPYEIGLHINKIYSILISTHTEQEVSKYTDIAPNRFLMMFAAICSTIKEYGDKRLEDGQWLFLKNMNHIKEELNIEILKKQQNKALFAGLKVISIIPVFLLKPIEMWATANMPEMAAFYTGGAGTIVMAFTFALVLICYQMICNLKDGRVDEIKESTLLNKMTTIPGLRGILTAEVNRNYGKSLRIGDDLKMVGEKIGPKEFLLKRLIFGIGVAIAFNIVVIFSQAQAKTNILQDFSRAYENSVVPNAEYRENMRNISKRYIEAWHDLDELDSSRDILARKIANQEGIKQSYAEMIVSELYTRIGEYKAIYYKWYAAAGTILAFAVGFYIPFLLLKYQISIMKMSMEDEVVQFQTLALILMHVDGVTINSLLEWMERFAFCFKDSISEAILNLEYSEDMALNKMKESETFPPFRRFVDNLLSIDNVGIVSAFDEIESEREYYKKKREQDNQIIMHKKAARGKIIAFVPLIGAIGGYMILPFLQMAGTMLGTMSDAIKTIQ